METDEKQPVTAVIVGCGHRAMIYAAYAKQHPDELKIVGAADPSEKALRIAAEQYHIPRENLFPSASALADAPKFADAVINGTMDSEHVSTSLPLLEKGYDMLIEKPFAVNEQEMLQFVNCAKKHGNRVMVCHVLRYAKFYRTIKELLLQNEIGTVITVSTNEYISYDHAVTSYVRGKWARYADCRSTMLLAKCSHDIDILTWLMHNDAPVKVTSFGERSVFTSENAPANAGTRCTLDCPLVDDCQYSAKKIYLERPGAWDGYVWSAYGGTAPDAETERLRSLNTDNPYGRCVFRCDNDVMDHQSLLIQFRSGAIGAHNVIAGASGGKRTIHITGTKGEIYGAFEENRLHVKKAVPTPDAVATETVLDFSDEPTDGHMGGDLRLTEDFIRYITGRRPSVSCTDLSGSVSGHMVVFKADESREKGGVPIVVPSCP